MTVAGFYKPSDPCSGMGDTCGPSDMLFDKPSVKEPEKAENNHEQLPFPTGFDARVG